MLDSISWSDFILTLLTAGCVYYVVVLLLFYSRDLARLVRGERSTQEPLPPTPSKKTTPNLIGETRTAPVSEPDQDVLIDESTQVISGATETNEDVSWNADPIVTNPLHRSFSQLIEEVNALAYIIAHDSKEEISLLFETLLSRYPQLGKAHYQASINQFIIEACGQYGEITLTHADIDSWWAHALNNNQHS